ncbi:YybH family protein [Flagellimonas marinaquae]|jgi:ketosteroid isomerase-like protein
MRDVIVLLLVWTLISCGEKQDKVVVEPIQTDEIDVATELAKIEQVRRSFEQTVKEKRYGDLGKFTTEDMISIGPGSEDWIAYRKLREKHGNKFRYDSIKMNPKETVILSDTMAYDFGVSSVYYTDENGTVHEMEDTFLVIMKKNKNGEWKLHREIASSLVID